MLTLQDTADAPPQMLLDNPEFTVYMSSLLEQVLQNGQNRHILEKSLKVVTRQVTPHGNPKTAGPTVLNRSGTLPEYLNRSQKNNNTPYWVPVVT